ncbi:hypothetical protein NET03_00710 [Thermomicrobium sp. CFH 73360]|uniref:hypothetical protein n=1 Tax=Thermomicrobium sp. CFH 73360 TaxID=2951987 RepID=UPI00207677D3|nr:hypothetical protein [Thermomicrobium sp. CFH 73360]MCM8745045.1 hypothetical protein [Thermomicrobium sp. CFH 73360]
MAAHRRSPPRLWEVVRTLVTALTQPPPHPPVSTDPGLREELRITLASRKELGPDYDRELVDHFLRQMDQAIEQRVEELWRERERRRRRAALGKGLTLTFVLLAAIPLTAAAGLTAGAQGIAVVWIGLVVVLVISGLLWRV